MRLKARKTLTYAGKEWQPGALFDAFGSHAQELISQDKAEPYNLEDPSTRSWSDIIEPYLPAQPTIPDVPPVTIAPTSAAPTAAGGPGSFQVTITGGGQSGTWMVDPESEASWITVLSPALPQSADGPVDYTVDINAGPERTGHMYVNGKTFTVVQAGTAAR
jgi:hypothetical protein